MISTELIEKCVLGELWIDTNNDYLHLVEKSLFLHEKSKKLFEFIKKNIDTRNDLVVLPSLLERQGYQKNLYEFCLQCSSAAVSVGLLPRHLTELKNTRRDQRILAITSNLKDRGLQNEEIEALRGILSESDTSSEAKCLEDLTFGYMDELYARDVRFRNGVEFKTGFPTLDMMTGGILPKNIMVIGARTSFGKSAMLINMACNLIKDDKKVLFISGEMTETEIIDRIVSQESEIESWKIMFGKTTENEKREIKKTFSNENFFKKPLHILFKPNMCLGDVKTAIKEVKPAVVFIDHIQAFVNDNVAGETEAQKMSNAMYEFKRIAGSEDIGFVVASQLNREEITSKSKLNSSNFKGSGGIEEAASVACKIKLADESQKENSDWDIILEVTKNRHGRIGTVPMVFKRKILKIKERKVDADKNTEWMQN